MANSSFSLILRLSIIIITVLFHHNAAQDRSASATRISVTALWDIIVSNDTQPCSLEENTSSHGTYYVLRGSEHQPCSIHVNVTLGFYTRIEIPNSSNIFTELFSLYIERQGRLDICTNKYLVYNENTEVCSSILLQDSLNINVHGDVSILVDGISALESQPVCPEYDGDILPSPAVNQTPNCKRVKGYSNQIMCELDNPGRCRLTFPSECNATLGHNVVTFQCRENDLHQTQESLIIYPTGVSILDIHYNNIIELEVNSFTYFSYLQELYLQQNDLAVLRADVFSGLHALDKLYIYGNILVHVDVHSFRGLEMLSQLRLNDNKLIILPSGLFGELKNLNKLFLYGNQMISLNEILFKGLRQLTILALDDNNLISLPGALFQGLGNLYDLYLNGNQLVTLNESLLQGLRELTVLDLSDNFLISLPDNIFQRLEYLYDLYLYGNQLVTLNENIFKGLSELTYLVLDSNNLISLPGELFQGLERLNELWLYLNQLVKLNERIFQGLRELTILSLSDNKLVNLSSSTFNDLEQLTYLSLGNNKLISLPERLFHGLSNLYELYLQRNQLGTLYSHLFNDLNKLRILSISENRLVTLPDGLFSGLRNLEYLILASNKLAGLGTNPLQGLFKLYHLYLNDNNLTYLDFDIFKDTVNITLIQLADNQLKDCPYINQLIILSYFNLRNNQLTAVTHDTFSALSNNSEIDVSQHEICDCYVPDGVKCSASDKRSPYLTCDRLLSDRVLVVLMWIIGINALGGNVFVLVWRRKHTNTYKVQDLLLSNLAMSDSLMGIYMLIVACADIYYGEYFPMQSETWRSGLSCRVAGSISIASTQLSLFFLTLISIDRFIGIKYPYSDNKLGKRSTIVTAVIIWVCSLALGIVPSILSGWNFKFYDNSHVCVGLPLALTKTFVTSPNDTLIILQNTYLNLRKKTYTTKFTGLVNGLYFSTALYLGLNCICYLVILVCYIEIFRAVTESAKQSGRTPDMEEQIKLARKVTAIVFTDFACVFPIIVLGILVQIRVIELPPSVYAWSVTFVLPINSAINPYLYTITEIISNNQKKKTDKTNQQSTSLKQMETSHITA